MDFPSGELEDDRRAEYQELAERIGEEALHALLAERDLESAAVIHPHNVRRVIRALEMHDDGISYAQQKSQFSVPREHYHALWFGLTRNREVLYERINLRVDMMFEQGLVDEVRGLMGQGLGDALTSMQAIGYKEIIDAFNGVISMDEARELIKMRSRRYAKRQLRGLSAMTASCGLIWMNVRSMRSLRISCIVLRLPNGPFPLVPTSPEPERAILVGVEWRDNAWPLGRSLDELERLAHTAGAQCVSRLSQRLVKPYPKSFIGSGKVEELCGLVHRMDADVVIFDDDLTPSQQSYLEKAVGEPVKIIDRTALILDIFGLHAQTREGRLQVQLAQLQYLLPRLRGMWSHLAKEQTRGGIGSRFGQGESQLEVDRRLIRNKIAALRRELKQVEQRRDVQSKSRIESPAFRVALAGYTNAGKSTLLNRLTGSTVLSQDKLFATLDPTTRSYRLPGGRGMTITDTVGFIQKLPHGLVDAFKSTLSEVLGADLILKVVDASDEDYERQLEAVDRVLDEIGAGERLTLTVFNKIDLLDSVDRLSFRRRYPEAVLFSAQTGEGLDDLVDRIAREAAATDVLLSADIPYREGALITLVHEQGTLLHEEYLEDGVRIVAKLPARIAPRLERYRTE